jgi:PAS domain S-box-containing protein
MKNEVSDKFILGELINHIPYAIFWKDAKFVFRGCNQEFSKQFGFDEPKEIIGKTDYDFPFPPHLREKYRHDDAEVLRGVAKLNYEEEQIQPNGTTKTVLVSKTPLYGENKIVIGILGIYADITERKRQEKELHEAKEKAEIASKTKTEFLENMRHDIRTPLTGITGFAEIIKNEVKDPKVKEYADNLTASSYALLDLLNAVLEAINVSSGDIPLLKKKFDLKEKLNSIILLNQAKARQKNLELQFEYDPAIPTYLIGDVTRLHKIALELVTNALNFTNKGHVRLSVRLAKDSEKDIIIKVIVEDTGIGIEPEKQQEIYLQFKRLTPSYEGIYKGFGLGLSIVKQFINDLEGELYVESKVGIGSTFTAVIKLQKPLLDEPLGSEDLLPTSSRDLAAPTVEITSSQKEVEVNGIGASSKQSRILVVEDNDIAARVITNLLAGMDCQVDVADKGKLAVHMADENRYDLIFMDIGLPDIDGYEVTKRIRLSELHKAHVPIIALTAHMDEDNKQHCIGIGMNAVLTKPLGKEKAEDILNSFVPYRKNQLKAAVVDAGSEAKIELPIFDFERVKAQFGNEKSALEMVAMFVDSLPQEVEQLQAAYNKKDWHSVQLLTHRLRGGVSYCGASRLDEVCSKLESAIRDEHSELWEELYQHMLNEISLAAKTIKSVKS